MINKLTDLLFKKVFYLKLKQKKRGKCMFTMNDEMVKNAVFMIIAGMWTIDDVMDFDNFKEMVIARLTFKKEEAKEKIKQEEEELAKQKEREKQEAIERAKEEELARLEQEARENEEDLKQTKPLNRPKL